MKSVDDVRKAMVELDARSEILRNLKGCVEYLDGSIKEIYDLIKDGAASDYDKNCLAELIVRREIYLKICIAVSQNKI